MRGKIALITGASSGIGWATAEAFAAEGVQLILCGRRESRLKALQNLLKVPSHVLVFDVADKKAVFDQIHSLPKAFSSIDILINNAGINIRSSFIDFKEEDWKKIFDINLSGAMIVTQAILPQMIKKNAGKIINMCSLYSALGRASVVPYSVSKGGLKMFTKALCAEIGKYNIQVNGIGPGFIETEMTQSLNKDASFNKWLSTRTPAGRWGNPKDLIGTVVFLASEASNFVNGQILHVDGGILASV